MIVPKFVFIFPLVIISLVAAYSLLFEEWSWKKVIIRIIGICAVTMPLLLIDNYRIFIISLLIAAVFEYLYLSKK